ncbi:E3 ubiquitin-ligase AIP2 [Micractinium conductrix]|uniref:RING-type E3 ubiquitin transferase n=1 Tax=Micractinium conductrix TaxID=554055 RepID=A0A2P6VNI8_9CHLO|nr:E3 ubiquitin-ligase AIP2 [Micractinium conductrix]|eukprot:PSC75615.1 E3 ubiquitin-ligase AIP2 [Micractinium conductrix]
MAAAALVQSPAAWAELTSALNKKATFEHTVAVASRELSSPAGAAAVADPAARTLLARCRTLLRTRYSSRAFWVLGRQLFTAAATAADAAGDAELKATLAEYLAECAAELGEEAGSSGGGADGGSAGAPPRGSAFLFEGQLSGQEAAPPRPPGLLDLLSGALPAELQQQLEAAAAQQQGGGGGGSGDGQGEGQQAQQAQQPSPEVLAAIEEQLDAIAVQIMDATGQQALRAPPPASKRAVASLPRETLSVERLAQLGSDVRCPVCMDELAVGEEVQVMPCSAGHIFHPPCLAPWLEQHNSCPTCRHELPTDDQRYEREKERRLQEEEDARGAANAVAHNDFLYI